MTLAKEIGLYMIIRPGPYVNAEANAGGLPLWATTGAYGKLRDNDPRYLEALTPYWANISKIIAPHLITNGGNVILYQIENEYAEQWLDEETQEPNTSGQEYMQYLEDVARENGIDAPLIHNLPNMVGQYARLLKIQNFWLIHTRTVTHGPRTSPTLLEMSMSLAWTAIPLAGPAMSVSVSQLTESISHM